MTSYRDLKKAKKELSKKLALEYGSSETDGSLPVQIAIFNERIKALSLKKDSNSTRRIMVMRKKQKELISNFRRIDRESANILETKLGLKK